MIDTASLARRMPPALNSALDLADATPDIRAQAWALFERSRTESGDFCLRITPTQAKVEAMKGVYIEAAAQTLAELQLLDELDVEGDDRCWRWIGVTALPPVSTSSTVRIPAAVHVTRPPRRPGFVGA